MDNEYIIKKNNSKSDSYLVAFLQEKELIKSISGDKIVIRVNSIISLDKHITKVNFLSLELLDNFIYDLGYQLLLMKRDNKGMLYLALSDIKIINDGIFLYLPERDILTMYNDFVSIPPMNTLREIKDKRFFSPELIKFIERGNQKYYSSIYFTCIYYSLSKLILYIFNIKLVSILNSKPYFFLRRCLQENPLDREFLFI